jgi:hypothetical protein
LKYGIFSIKVDTKEPKEKKVFFFSEHLVWSARGKSFLVEFILPLRETRLLFRADDPRKLFNYVFLHFFWFLLFVLLNLFFLRETRSLFRTHDLIICFYVFFFFVYFVFLRNQKLL